MEADNPTLAWARYYHKLGLHPIPVKARDKKPIGTWKKWQTEQPSAQDLKTWFGSGKNNIGLVLGRGLIAVDLDGEGAEELLVGAGVELPASAPRTRTGNGFHVFLRVGEDLGDRVGLLGAADGSKPQVDIRGVGFVVAPPSVHPSGHVYEWERRIDKQIPAAPEALLALIRKASGASKSGQDGAQDPKTGSDTPKWVSEALKGVGEGKRDATCAKLAGYYLGKGMPQDIVKSTLYAWGTLCRPPFPPAEVDKTVDSVGRRDAAAQAAAVEAQAGEFQILGYNQGDYFYLPRGSRQVVALRAEQHSKLQLLRLAPLQYWEHEYAGKQGVQWDMAANALIRQCEANGVYDIERVRGRGAWWDGERAVLHVGDALIVDGERQPLRVGRYIYEAAPPMPVSVEAPLEIDEAQRLIEISELVNWEHEISAHLFAGWCAVAPICGALSWRPHVWLTGPAGSGKTWVMDKIARSLLSSIGLAVQSETTEAGLRQTLGQDARPVTFDEIEGEDERAQMRVQNVLALARQASSETGAVIIKGSPLGQAKTYRIRSCFGFSSIGVGVDKHADATRVTILSVLDKNRVEGAAEKFKKLDALVAGTITEEYARRFIARSIRLVPQIRANARTLASAGAAVIGSQRLGDQIGALLAGCYSLYGDELLTPAQALQWVEEQAWTEQKQVHDVTDEQRCLSRILEHVVRVQAKSFIGERSIGELIRCTALLSNDQILPDEAEKILWRLGIRVDRQGNDEDFFTISNTHTAIEDILRGTPWARGWGRVLRRVAGAQPSADKARFGAVKSRGIEIPLGTIE